jgi:hypothetical protein
LPSSIWVLVAAVVEAWLVGENRAYRPARPARATAMTTTAAIGWRRLASSAVTVNSITG